jgi:protein phosphatase 1 regulatory subunit 42
MESLVHLTKLYIERNCISKLEGLQNCQSLEELYLNDQKLSKTQEFTFDDYSMATLSVSDI